VTGDRWTKLESLFHQALDQPEGERSAFLDRACAHDPSLRPDLDALLRQAGRSGDLLSAPAADWARQVAAASLRPGHCLGPYEVVAWAGAGGMGEVYRARDIRLDRPVALKLLPAELARDPEWARRFEREARVLSALNHPNVVTVHDVGEAEGRPWIATEFVAGETLRARMARGRLPVSEALDIVRQVLAGLAAAHDAGIVHRDVKPENVMVRTDGLVKLLDFGLARPLGPDAGLTGDATRLGTARYMSPEQLAGGEVGRPSDVWSAGVVLAEMLAGGHPFPGTTPAEAVAAIQKEPPRLPSGISFRPVIEKALARSPDDRYPGARAMLEALSHPWSWPVPRRWWWGAAALVALVIMSVVAATRGWRSHQPFDKTEVRRLATLPNVHHAAISPDGAFLAYADEGADHATLRLQQMNGSAARVVPAEAPFGFAGVGFSRDGYLYYAAYDATHYGQLYRVPLVGGSARWILRDIDSPPAFAPDGRRVAFVRHDNRRGVTSLVVAPLDGTAERVVSERRLPLGFSTEGGAWDREGRRVLLAAAVSDPDGSRRAALLEVDAETGATRERGSGHWSWIGSVSAAGPAGLVFPAVVTGAQRTQIVRLSWSGRQGVIDTATAQGSFLRVAATEDRRQLLVVHADRTAAPVLASRDRLDAPERLPVASGPFYDVAFGPPPYLLAQLFAGLRPGLVRISREGTVEPLLAGDWMARRPVAAPGGDAVVFVAQRQGIDQIWRVAADGTGAVPLTGGPGSAGNPTCCTTDGRVVYEGTAGGYAALWAVPLRGGTAVSLSARPALVPTLDETGTRLAFVDLAAPDAVARQVVTAPMDALDQRTPVLEVPPGAFFRWSPGGRALTFVRTVDGVSNLWEAPLSGGRPRPLTHFTSETLFGFDWSRDGRELVLLRGGSATHLLLITEREE
jgi:eukaryotic-like serine/threonine-protein kinase